MPKKRKEKLPVYVLVIWVDSSIQDRQIAQDEHYAMPTPSKIVSVGILLKHDAVGVTIARDGMHGDYRGIEAIPACAVLQINRLIIGKTRIKGARSGRSTRT